MMPLRSVIIDDEQKGIDALTLLIERYIPDVKIVAKTVIADQAIELIENYKPEIVFLDINMPEMSGFELLKQLHWRDFNLVFTTAHQEYALMAIKNNAIDYLLKPIDYEDLILCVEKIRRRLTQNRDFNTFNFGSLSKSIQQAQKQRLIINSKSDMESVDIHEIVCLESRSNYTKISLANSREIITSKTLKEFEQLLCTTDSPFMRVHHSFIVNLNKVSRYLKTTDDIIMSSNHKIPLARGRKDIFIRWLNI